MSWGNEELLKKIHIYIPPHMSTDDQHYIFVQLYYNFNNDEKMILNLRIPTKNGKQVAIATIR